MVTCRVSWHPCHCREVKGERLTDYAASHGACAGDKTPGEQSRAMKAVIAVWLEVVEVSWGPGFSCQCFSSWKQCTFNGRELARSPPDVVV